jgi:hypothetical protein
MNSQEEFVAEVSRQFQFLETDYGMQREAVQSGPGRAWVTFGNVNVKVIVEIEHKAYVHVTVQNLRQIKHDSLERSEFDLDEIIAASPRPPRRQDFRANRESLARAAEMLRTVGAPVLQGDFEALRARQLKAVEAIRSHDAPPLPNNEPEYGRKR